MWLHTKKGEKLSATAQKRRESLKVAPKWAQIMSFLPNHVPDITTSVDYQMLKNIVYSLYFLNHVNKM